MIIYQEKLHKLINSCIVKVRDKDLKRINLTKYQECKSLTKPESETSQEKIRILDGTQGHF